MIAILLSASNVSAGDSPEDIKQRIGSGDPVAGKVKSLICQACHGKEGSPAKPDCPKLSGQYAVYIQKQIKDFQKGSRKDPVMTDIAIRLTNEQDLLDISAYFAAQFQMKGDSQLINTAGKRRFTAGNGCQTCHGKNGKGLAPNDPRTPVIGGQHKDYLIKQLKDFRSNARTNESTGMMGMIADLMSDAQIEAVASYESGL
ncbi:MAG: c-type cytochrome [Gallionella sp.]